MITSADTLSLEVNRDGTRIIACFTNCDSLNEFNSDCAGQQLAGLVEGQTQPHLVLDLRNIRYATSSALGKFIGLNRLLRTLGGHFVLSNPNRAVAEALAVTKLDTILEIQTDDRELEQLSA